MYVCMYGNTKACNKRIEIEKLKKTKSSHNLKKRNQIEVGELMRKGINPSQSCSQTLN
jgi:hypothetical protein